jgi:hypothetical protein
MAAVPKIRSRVPAAIDGAMARAIVEESIKTYFRKRRSRVPGFVDATFSFSGALSTHRRALGHDLWRAPLNLAMAGPQFALNAAANVLDRTGKASAARKLRSRELFFRTSVAEEIERRLIVDLLELPYTGPGEPSFRDALAVEILGHSKLDDALGALNGAWGETERKRLDTELSEQLAIYLNARTAVGEVTSATLALGIGAATIGQFTPGFLTLGTALAQALSAKVAGTAASFVAGATVIAASAAASAFSGIVTDPLQRATGLHHRRLIALLDALETAFLGGDARLRVPEQYAARLIDLVDAIASILAHARAVP